MALTQSPKLVMDGLVLAYDAANVKSFSGEQTVNVLYTSGAIDWSVYGLTGTITLSTVTTNSVYRITNATASTVNFRIAANYTKLTNNLPYNMSYKYKFISGGAIFAMTDWCDTSLSNVVNTDYNTYKYSSAYGTRSTYDSTYCFMDINISANTVVEIWDIQLEQKTYATPYVLGTRGNTPATGGGFLDLSVSGKNASYSGVTCSTAGRLTYNGSAYASFDSTGLNFSVGQTVMIALKPSTGASSARRNPYNQAYGGYGTITHEPSGQFNYYHGTNGGDGNNYQGITSTMTVAENETAIIALTRGTSYVKWYKNGAYDTQVGNSYPNAVSSVNTTYIGTGYTTNYLGDINVVLLYTRELSAAEIKQNFDALRGRYGL